MWNYRLIVLSVSAGLLLWTPFPALGQSDDEFKKERLEKRKEQLENLHKDQTGKVRPDLWKKGIEDFKKMKIAAGIRPVPKAGKKTTAVAAAGGVVGVQWTQIGPQPLRIINAAEYIYMGTGPDSGEVTDIAIDPRNSSDQVVYIATDDGGIWKTTDGGNTWAPKTDYMPSLSMGAVALDPNNPSVVYAGTGNLFDMGGIFFKGVGLYKSTDMGETWSQLNPGNIFDGLGVNRISVLPGSGVVLVATNQGLFRSNSGGVAFGNNNPNFNNGLPVRTGYISDLDVDTTTPTTVYASIQGTGIMRSTDSGVTFPTDLFNNPGAPASFAWIVLAQSVQPDNQRIYALIQRTDNGRRADLYWSTDTGASWNGPSAGANARSAENNGCQCPADQTLGVDPQDPDRVYIGFQELYLSTDGGTNFGTPGVSRNKIHWDHHALTFSPPGHWGGGGAPTRIWVGTDGGVHASTDGGAAWANLNETIATSLIHHLDIGRNSSTNNGYSYGATWDTGTNHRHPGFAGNDWHLTMNGDGTSVAVSQSNPLIVFAGRNGGFKKTVTGGVDNWAVASGAGLPACANLCSMEIAVDPNNDDNVFAYTDASGTNLYRSINEGANFAAIETFSTSISGSWLWTFATAKADSNTLWVGLVDGKVARTSNALAADPSFTELTVTGAPAGQPVTGIAINPLNSFDVVVVYPGFCGGGCAAGNRKKHVFRTLNNGTNWTDISGTDGNPLGNLPDLPTHSVVFDPGTGPASIIVSTDAGVARSANNGATWEVFGVGMPTVDSKQLALDPSASPSLLRIGTYGRSAFELTSATGPLLAVNADLGFGTLCLGTRATRIVQVFNVGSTDLHISSFFRASGSTEFRIISGPSTPVTVAPGEEIDFTIEFAPVTAGSRTAVFQINSDDPFQPARQLQASGDGASQSITTWIANSGNFGDVCLGAFQDLMLSIGNNGCGTLSVNSIASSTSQFKVPVGVPFPITIAAGTSTQIPIRFEPTTFGLKTANITVTSNAPGPAVVIPVSGIAPPPDIDLTGSTDFGNVCAGALAEKQVSVCNVGKCTLHVTSVSLGSCTDFQIINNPFPAPVSPDFCVPVTMRFTPTSAGPKACTLTVVSDDPDEVSVTLPVSGTTPVPSIDVPPSMSFLPEVNQTIGVCTTAKPFPISNTGGCNLNINSIALGGPEALDYSLSGLPSYPIILQPGHVAGEGNLKTVFGPTVVDRDRIATLGVTYESDPITHATTLVSRDLCGEGAMTGARVLVRSGTVPVPLVSKIQIQRTTGNRNRPIVDTVDVSKNLTPQTVSPSGVCPSFQYHKEYGTVSNPLMLLPGSYTVTATATVGGKNKSKTVGFNVTTCDFNPSVVIDF